MDDDLQSIQEADETEEIRTYGHTRPTMRESYREMNEWEEKRSKLEKWCEDNNETYHYKKRRSI